MLRLENWSVVTHPTQKYFAPELRQPCLHGILRGKHRKPSLADGDTVTTSPIKGFEGKLVVTITGSKYQLGKPSDEYKKLYPRPFARLLKAWLQLEQSYEKANDS